jgi:hypothetical protein
VPTYKILAFHEYEYIIPKKKHLFKSLPKKLLANHSHDDIIIRGLERRMKMGVASLVLGIIALVWSIFGGTFLSALVGIIGIILGAVAKKQAPSGVATAGLVLSIIATILSLIFWIACAACIGAAGML